MVIKTKVGILLIIFTNISYVSSARPLSLSTAHYSEPLPNIRQKCNKQRGIANERP